MTAQTKHNFSHFYALLKQIPFSGDRNELKDALIYRYTDGRTKSLKEMYYTEYLQMCANMRALIIAQAPTAHDANQWRKRVMAVIAQYLRNLRKPETAHNIKSIACRATQYDDFNLIPINRLKNVYYTFLNKNKDFFSIGAAVEEDLKIIACLN